MWITTSCCIRFSRMQKGPIMSVKTRRTAARSVIKHRVSLNTPSSRLLKQVTKTDLVQSTYSNLHLAAALTSMTSSKASWTRSAMYQARMEKQPCIRSHASRKHNSSISWLKDHYLTTPTTRRSSSFSTRWRMKTAVCGFVTRNTADSS